MRWATGLVAAAAAAAALVQDGQAAVNVNVEADAKGEDVAGWNAFVDAGGMDSVVGMAVQGMVRNLQQNPQFNALNAALNGVQFGSNPGPCTSYADACVGDVANMPDYIKAVKIELPVVSDTTIGEAVKSGQIKIWDLRCSNLAIEDIVVTQGPLKNSGRKIPVDILVDDLRMDCFTRFELVNVVISVRFGWLGSFSTTLNGFGDLYMDKNRMGGNNNGVVVDLGTEFNSAAGFANAPPDSFNFLNDRAGCYVSISSGLRLNNLDLDGIGPIMEWVIELIIFSLFRGLFEGIVCQVITQTAYLEPSGAPGGGNIFIQQLRDDLAEIVGPGSRSRSDFEADEAANPGRLRNIEPEKALNLRTNTLFETLSVGLNKYLGADSTEPGYENRPVINEVFDVLNKDKSGTVKIDNLMEFFDLEEFPFVDFDTVLTRNRLEFTGFRFEGLNKFTTFQALDNGFADPAAFGEKYDHTALTDFRLEFFRFMLGFRITMQPGEWVNPAGARRTIAFNFRAGLKLNDVNVKVATYQLLQENKILELEAGQLLGDNTVLEDQLTCALIMVDHFRLSGLQASAASIEDPELLEFFDLGPLVADALNLFNAMFKPTLSKDLPAIMDNYARVLINEWLDDTFFMSELPPCPPYVPLDHQGDARYFNLRENLAVQVVDEALTEVVGGDPITANSLDINRLIETTIEYVFIERADSDSSSLIINKGDGSWEFSQKIDETFTFPFNGTSGRDDVFGMSVGPPRVNNANSIYRLIVTPNATNDYALDFLLSIGDGCLRSQSGDPICRGPLRFALPTSLLAVVSDEVYAQNEFDFVLELELNVTGEIDLKLVRNELYLSVIENLFTPACALAILERKTLDPLDVSLGEFKFGIVRGTNFDTSNRFGEALQKWSDELQTEASRQTTEYFLNYVINRITNATQEIFNKDFDPPYTRVDCLTQVSPFNGSIFDSPLPLPDLNAIADDIRIAFEPPGTGRGGNPSEWEDLIASENDPIYDITAENNEYVAALSVAINVDNTRSALIAVANTTVNPEIPSILDPLYQIFYLEEDDSVSMRLDLNVLTSASFEPDTEGILPGLKIKFQDLRITNVDSFTGLDVLKPYESDRGDKARFTTSNVLSYKDSSLLLTFGIQVEVAAEIFEPNPIEPLLYDTVNVTLNLTGVRLETLFAAAVNQTDLAVVQLGEVFYFDEVTHLFAIRPDAFNCTMKRILYEDGLFFQQFQVFADSLEGPEITIDGNILNTGSANVLNAFIEMMVATVRKRIPDITQGFIMRKINGFLRDVTRTAKKTSTCKGVQYPDYAKTGRFFNFSRSSLSQDIDFFVNTDLLGPGQLNINSLLDRFVNLADFGSFDVFNNSEVLYNGINLGLASWDIGSIRFEDLGTQAGARVNDLEILQTDLGPGQPPFENPNKDYKSRSSFKSTGTFEVSFLFSYSFDGLFVDQDQIIGGGSSRRVLDASAMPTDSLFGALVHTAAQDAVASRRALAASAGDPGDIADLPKRFVKNDLRMGVRFTDLEILLDLMTRVDIEAALNIYAGNLLNLYYKPNEVPCLLAIFDYKGLSFEVFEIVTSALKLTVRCEGTCNSPLFAPLQDVGQVTDEETSEALTETFNGVLNALTSLAGSTNAQEYINLAISSAKEECIGAEFDIVLPDDVELDDAASVMGFVGLGVFGGALAGMMALLPVHSKNRNQVMAVAYARLNANAVGEAKGMHGKVDHLRLIEQRLKAPVAHPAVPLGARIGVPVCILIVVGLFLAANLGTIGATVSVRFDLAGDRSVPLPILDFTLASSINDMWNSGAIVLGLLIFLASGFWPHTKSLLLLVCWFAPPTVLGHKTRGELLKVLDSLGKWSLVDAYVLILLMVSFRIFFSSTLVSQLDFLPKDILVVDVAVIPRASIYLFVIATMMALVINHYMIAIHYKIIAADEKLEDEVNGLQRPQPFKAKRSISKHVFLVPDQRNLLYGFSPATKLSVGALLVLSTLFVVAGSFLDIMRFDFLGVGGIALGFVDEDLASKTYSSVGIALDLPDGVPDGDTAAALGVLFLQVIFFACNLIAPIGLAVIFALLWFLPMRLREQERLLFVAEILYAWEGAIVLALSLIAAVLQISPLSQFIVQAASGGLCELITEPLLFFGVPRDDAKCFDVEATFLNTGFVLVTGIFLSLIASFFFFRIFGAAVADRAAHELGHLDKKGFCPKTTTSFWPRKLLLRAAVRPVSRIRVNNQIEPRDAFDSFDGSSPVESTNPAFAVSLSSFNLDSANQAANIDV